MSILFARKDLARMDRRKPVPNLNISLSVILLLFVPQLNLGPKGSRLVDLINFIKDLVAPTSIGQKMVNNLPILDFDGSELHWMVHEDNQNAYYLAMNQ